MYLSVLVWRYESCTSCNITVIVVRSIRVQSTYWPMPWKWNELKRWVYCVVFCYNDDYIVLSYSEYTIVWFIISHCVFFSYFFVILRLVAYVNELNKVWQTDWLLRLMILIVRCSWFENISFNDSVPYELKPPTRFPLPLEATVLQNKCRQEGYKKLFGQAWYCSWLAISGKGREDRKLECKFGNILWTTLLIWILAFRTKLCNCCRQILQSKETLLLLLFVNVHIQPICFQRSSKICGSSGRDSLSFLALPPEVLAAEPFDWAMRRRGHQADYSARSREHTNARWNKFIIDADSEAFAGMSEHEAKGFWTSGAGHGATASR